jgi:3-hydroxybutyrate dehydrogenase
MSESEVISKVILAKQAIKEFVPANIIADMAFFLASDMAASKTGTSLPIDGGWSAH